MAEFKSYQQYAKIPRVDFAGKLSSDEKGKQKFDEVKVDRWSTEFTIQWLRNNGKQMAREACKDGWQVNLIDFVQHQHKLPNPEQCEQLVLDFQKIEKWTQHSPKRQQIIKNRERIKTQLMRQLEVSGE